MFSLQDIVFCTCVQVFVYPKTAFYKNVFVATCNCIIFGTRYDKHKTYNKGKTVRLVAELNLSCCINDSNAFRQTGGIFFINKT